MQTRLWLQLCAVYSAFMVVCVKLSFVTNYYHAPLLLILLVIILCLFLNNNETLMSASQLNKGHKDDVFERRESLNLGRV